MKKNNNDISAQRIYKKAIALVNFPTHSCVIESSIFNKLILCISLLSDNSELNQNRALLCILVQKYMLSIHSGAEWYKYFESNSSGACFMSDPINYNRDGENCLLDYIDYRLQLYNKIRNAITEAPTNDAPYIILYWMFTFEEYGYMPCLDPINSSFEEVVDINDLRNKTTDIKTLNDFKSAYNTLLFTINNIKIMEQTFSFRYIKLGIGLILLLISAILPGIGQYMLMALGGITLMTAFASFANYGYRGVPTKIGYKIGRYALAVVLLAVAAIQIYVQIVMPNSIHYSPYSTVVDATLIAYLLMFKPSNTTKGKRVLKVIGYTAILIGVNALQNSHQVVKYLTYTSTEINWSAIFISVIVMAIGIVSLIFGGKK